VVERVQHKSSSSLLRAVAFITTAEETTASWIANGKAEVVAA